MMKNKDVNANISRFFLFHHSFIKWSIWNIFLKILYLIYRLAFLARVSAVCWLSRYYTASSWLYPGTLLVTSLFHDASFPLGKLKDSTLQSKILAKFLQFKMVFSVFRSAVYSLNFVTRNFWRLITSSVTESMSFLLNRFCLVVWWAILEIFSVHSTSCNVMKSVASCLNMVSLSLIALPILKLAIRLIKCPPPPFLVSWTFSVYSNFFRHKRQPIS